MCVCVCVCVCVIGRVVVFPQFGLKRLKEFPRNLVLNLTSFKETPTMCFVIFNIHNKNIGDIHMFSVAET